MGGTQKAKKKGVKFGRKKKLSKKQRHELELRKRRKKGELINDLMTDYGLSKASVYRYLGKTA
jgi:DNA invertase Pin-like site-specific DNA recombinase